MEILIYFCVFIFGLVAGSFLNSIIYRLKTGESFLFRRSYCPHCKHQLSWQDLVPLLSFLALRGKCRYCHKPISLRYPLVELATGILFVLVLDYKLGIMNYGLFNFENILTFLFMILASCFLIIIFVYDLKHYIIPDKIIYPAIAIALLYSILHPSFVLNAICAASGAAAFFLIIVLVSRGKWMGVGDIKLAFFMGLFLGWPDILVALFLAFFIGAIIGVGLIVSKRKTLKSAVPFGPFLTVGTFIALFWGQSIINWYLSLFW